MHVKRANEHYVTYFFLKYDFYNMIIRIYNVTSNRLIGWNDL